jgi:UDP-galactopyranose mutase
VPRAERWVPLRGLLAEVHSRFRRPLFISETSHFGCGRARWIREIVQEVLAARTRGVPLEGICLYPIIDRHDWEDAAHWHRSGLWELETSPCGELRRVLDAEYALEVLRCMRTFEDSLDGLPAA